MSKAAGMLRTFIHTWWKRILVCGIIALALSAGLEALQH